MSTVVCISAVYFYYILFLFAIPLMIKRREISSMEAQISIAQSIKNFCGIKRIIGSRYGLNTQFTLPGKNILWKIVNALLKF